MSGDCLRYCNIQTTQKKGFVVFTLNDHHRNVGPILV